MVQEKQKGGAVKPQSIKTSDKPTKKAPFSFPDGKCYVI